VGERALSSILPSEVQAWVKRLSVGPCEGTKLPTVEKREVAPMTTE
jgi:hypothetical protein